MKLLGFQKSENRTPDRKPRARKNRSVLFWMVWLQIFLFVIATGWSLANPFLQRRRAIDEIRRLGGIVHEEPRGPKWLKDFTRNLKFDQSRKVVDINLNSVNVTDETTQLLACFPEIRQISIHGPQLTGKGLENLYSLDKLQSLMLVNCPGISAKDEDNLHKALPHVEITRRGAALLGISGKRKRWGCEIVVIRPNSGASRAGLKEGDIIFSFDGSRVREFQTLTELIAEYQPGDEVFIGYIRGRRRYSVDVTLGSWTDNTH